MKLEVSKPDDFHVHLRDGDMLRAVAPWTARHFARALVMPNVPAIHDGVDAAHYRHRIREAAGPGFEPLMTIKLTGRTTPGHIWEARDDFGVVAAKAYPSGVTTASDDGIDLLSGSLSVVKLDPIWGAMCEAGMVLCIHGELPGMFCLDRERWFLQILDQIVARFPRLRVVLEHITTEEAAYRVLDGPPNLAATITPHHLVMTLDDVIGDRGDGTGSRIRPHNYCLPVAKLPRDRNVLRKAATSGHPRLFLGTDSAPHFRDAKESACGCAGVFNAPVALPVLAEVFDSMGELGRLEDFASRFGAGFYGLPLNQGTVTLADEPWTVPAEIGGVVPFRAGETLAWRVEEAT